MHSYIAKQAILNTDLQVVAYELLYRDSLDNTFPSINAEIATNKLVTEHLLGSDLEQIVGDKPYFINFTEQSLLDGLPMQLLNQPLVVEVLEDVQPSDEVFTAIKALKAAGFTIALDDFIYTRDWERFLPFTDIIKFDISQTSFSEIGELQSLLNKYDIKMLIEKIETETQFIQAKALKSLYYQGYYFSRPEVILNKVDNLYA